ncbi:hypothetical protein AB9E65_05970 [Escherichia coli]|uniref:hypothetical protein n=1 Tax=Escherichia coli TaxID=562 RepID=UPI0038B4E963
MDKGYIEIFKILSPFIILTISVILIPLMKKFYSSYISFFSLPTSKKIEGIEYINGYKKSSSTLEKLKHKIIINDYKLHEDTNFSKWVISFYYEDIGKNGYFSKSLLRAKGLYVIANNSINVNIKNTLFALAFWLLTFCLYYLSYYFSPGLNNGLANAVLAISLIVSALFYTCIMLIISSRFISIVLNKKRFNEYLRSKL